MPSKAGLYLHIPFCSRICPYCDFAVTRGSPEDRSRYTRLLEAEIGTWRDEPFVFDTLYLGGGTPSTVEAVDLERLFETVHERLTVDPDARVYLEANPEDVERSRLRRWRALGVGTLSVGVQSFDRSELKRLGRRHASGQAERCVEWAREAGFETVSVDLIYGLPGQTLDAWRSNLENLVRLAPDHVSCYQLTYHESTPFGRGLRKGVLEEPTEEGQAAFFELTHEFLRDAGYDGYEVSNFSREPRHRSLHNQKYWDHTAYLGLGVSAHSFRGRERWWNEKALPEYERRVRSGESPVAGREVLSTKDLALEAVMLRLRTRAGIPLDAFRTEYGFDLLARNGQKIERYVEAALLRLDAHRLLPTVRGMAVADSIARELEIE